MSFCWPSENPCLCPVVPGLILQWILLRFSCSLMDHHNYHSGLLIQVHFIHLVKLPSTSEIADPRHVFQLHGLPSNIVSDCGPQFTCHISHLEGSLLVITLNQMDRQKELTKTWIPPSAASQPIIAPPGPLFSLGWSILITPSPAPLRE